MLNADDTDVLLSTLVDLTDKNLFSYCDNNPIMREDSGGDFWGGLAFAGGGTLGAIGGANFWNPVGWVVIGFAVVGTAGYIGYKYYKSKQMTNTTVKSKSKESKFKKPKSKASGKEKANDVPSWAKGKRPYVGESGNEFARRLCNEKFGPGNYKKGPRTPFDQIRKWGDRGFE